MVNTRVLSNHRTPKYQIGRGSMADDSKFNPFFVLFKQIHKLTWGPEDKFYCGEA